MNGCSRRGFLGGAAALFGAGGCRMAGVCCDKPQLRFGVISDTHITDQASAALFERTLRYFDSRKVDAVMVPGDISDWGLMSGLRYAAEAWRRVFPKGRGSDGRKVERLFCTGNHDYEGWWYGDMTMEMHALGYSEDEALVNLGMKKCWEEAFDEPFDLFRRRTVNGFEFISSEFEVRNKAGEWFAANASTFDSEKPFFYFTHYPAANTVSSTQGRTNLPDIAGVLDRFPNLFAFTGHTHWTLNDERSIWQDGGLTAISVPSLSYTSIPRGYENGYTKRDGKGELGMGIIPSRPNLLEAQGFFVSVYDSETVVERYDFEECEEAADPWIVPMPPAAGRPYSFAEHAKRVPVPEFPGGAAVKTRIVNSDRRNGKWTIFVALEFPAARAPSGGRVFDYEARAVAENGAPAVSKKFLSPAFYRLERHEPETVSFLFDAMDLPESGRYRFEVVARNCFGAESAPVYSRYFQSVPGKDKAKRIAGRGG